jgi:HEPN superfamily RES-like protein/RES domain-containing protein
VNLVGAELDEESCSYCDAPRAAHISVLCDVMSEAIARHYVDPAEELPHDSGEGGYQGEVLSGSEIIADEFDPWTDCDELRDEVSEAFAEGHWCRRNYFGLSPYESLHFSWQGFCEVVKHRTRYFFLHKLESEQPFDERISPADMMEEIRKLFEEFELFLELPPSTDLFRARAASSGLCYTTAAELGTAPREAARYPNRMSPAGIPMFYATLDEETAILETYDPKNEENREIALARFRNVRPLHLLDLTSLPPIPSLFDPSQNYERPRIAFLHSFESDFTKPVSRENEAHTEYVPTQVVTEYVRHHLRTPAGSQVDGILYRSARRHESIAVVIFAESKDCGPRPNKHPLDPEPYLELISVRQISNEGILDLLAKNEVELFESGSSEELQ